MGTTRRDVIVLGIGGMGSAAGAHLAERGHDVLGLERFDVPHTRGSSHGSTRIIRLAYYEHPSYVPLLRRASENWRALETETGRDLLHVTGSIDAGPADGPLFEGSRRSCEEHGLDHEVLTGSEVNERFPGYDLPRSHRAVYQPEGGFVVPERCIVAQVETAQAHGAEIRARERVTDWWALEDGGVRVETTADDYEADRLVVTAGAWTGTLLPDLGDVLEPERQVLAWLQPENPPAFQPDAFPVWNLSVEEGRYYGLPVYDVPGFKFGRYHHRGETVDPDDWRTEPDAEDERLLREFAERYFPDGAGPTMGLATCMFTNTPDEHFVVDTLPNRPQVAVAAGFSGHGFKFASVVGEVLADLAESGRTDHPIDLFSADRF